MPPFDPTLINYLREEVEKERWEKKLKIKVMGEDAGETVLDSNETAAPTRTPTESSEQGRGSDLLDGTKSVGGVSIQRYKGLGEMNPEQLWETTMDPQARVLRQINVKDAEEADTIFDILMGSEVAPRKRFIQTHAKTVKNLDV